MWNRLLDRFLTGMMVEDRLSITYPNGETRDYGPDTGARVHLHITDKAALRALILNPDLGLGEGFMAGTVAPKNCTLDEVMTILIRNRSTGGLPAWMQLANRARFRVRRFVRRNAPQTARRNVAHHYDISDDLYRRFLDEDMQYSCAYFRDADMTLEQAQAAKKAHIAAKLQLEPGMRVLDIGCGWGGMALTLARDYGCEVTGITLSENQLATARARAEAAGLDGRVRFELRDYRHMTGTFDRVVSVGMLEHVGARHWDTYHATLRDLLNEDGAALVHTIGHRGADFLHSTWMDRYIFPGFEIPSLGELTASIDKSGLWICDVEPLRLHYARTLGHWNRRFRAASLGAPFDEPRFQRMWRYYLTTMEASFTFGSLLVYQSLLSRKIDTLPVTRDYVYAPGTNATGAAQRPQPPKQHAMTKL